MAWTLAVIDGHGTHKIMKIRSFYLTVLLVSLTLAGQTASAETSPDPAAAARRLSIAQPIQQWYAAWENKDWNMLEQAFASGFTFSSPLDDHIDVAHVKSRCWPNAEKIKRFDLEKVVVTGDDTFVISTCWTIDGKFARNCDCFRLKDGKIAAYECFFGQGINFPNSGK